MTRNMQTDYVQSCKSSFMRGYLKALKKFFVFQETQLPAFFANKKFFNAHIINASFHKNYKKTKYKTERRSSMFKHLRITAILLSAALLTLLQLPDIIHLNYLTVIIYHQAVI